MPDLSPLVAPVFELLAPALGHALKAFVKTTFGMVVLSVLLAAASILIAADGSLLRGALAAVLALALGTGVGIVLSGKRAVGRASLHGLAALGVGARLVDLIFGRLLRLDEFRPMGERGAAAAQAVERLPLAQAEAALAKVVRSLIAERPEGSGLRAWLARAIQQRLLLKIEELTLARFREQGTREGGVDLVLVRNELAPRIDSMLREQIEGGLTRLTVLAVLGVSLVSLGAAYGIRQLQF